MERTSISELLNVLNKNYGSAGSVLEIAANQGLQAGLTLPEFRDLVKKEYIRRALEASEGCQVAAARALGVHRNTLMRDVERLGLHQFCQHYVVKKPAGREIQPPKNRAKGVS